MKKTSLILAIIFLFTIISGEVLARRYDKRSRDRHVHRKVIVVDKRDRHRHRRNSSAVAAGVAGLAIGAMIGSAASQPKTVVVQQPVVIAPTYGSVVYSLPSDCSILTYNGVQYYQCNGVFHQPIMGSNGVYYKIIPPPY